MRVPFAPTANTGHFGPLVPVARACAAAGHEVAVAAPGPFTAEVATAGFLPLPFADPAPEVLGPVFTRLSELPFAAANRVVIVDVFGRIDARAALPGLSETVARWRPDVLVREPAEFASLVVAAAAGLPQLQVSIWMGRMADSWDDIVAAALAEMGALAGLTPGPAAAAARTAPVLTCVPAVLDGPADRDVLRYRVAPPAADAPLPTWGDPREPLVYVTFGTVAARLREYTEIYPATLQALATLPVRVLMTTGVALDPDLLGPVPVRARVEFWRDQAAVLPDAAVVVGHGGFGTTMAAAAALAAAIAALPDVDACVDAISTVVAR